MNFFKKLFHKKASTDTPPIPSWNEIVDIMYDKQLDTFSDEVVKAVYSKNKSMRYVILKSKSGFFTYQLEKIYQFDEDEWKYIFSKNNVLSAVWQPFTEISGKSFFENEEKLLKEIKNEPEYKQYFC